MRQSITKYEDTRQSTTRYELGDRALIIESDGTEVQIAILDEDGNRVAVYTTDPRVLSDINSDLETARNSLYK